jgi:hypothetical protein
MLALLMLLLTAYLGSYLLAIWAMSNGYEEYVAPISRRIYPVWKPIDLYCERDLPLSRDFDRFAYWFRSGGRLSWSEATAAGDRLHDQRMQWRAQRR